MDQMDQQKMELSIEFYFHTEVPFSPGPSGPVLLHSSITIYYVKFFVKLVKKIRKPIKIYIKQSSYQPSRFS